MKDLDDDDDASDGKWLESAFAKDASFKYLQWIACIKILCYCIGHHIGSLISKTFLKKTKLC